MELALDFATCTGTFLGGSVDDGPGAEKEALMMRLVLDECVTCEEGGCSEGRCLLQSLLLGIEMGTSGTISSAFCG